MASLAETLIGGAQQVAERTGEAVATGLQQRQQQENVASQLALEVERNQQAQQRIAQQKEQLELQKLNSLFTSVERGHNLPADAKKSFFKNFLPNKAAALGLGPDKVSPAMFEMMQQSPDTMLAIAEARAGYIEGRVNPATGQRWTSADIFNLMAGNEESIAQIPLILADIQTKQTQKAQIERQQLQEQQRVQREERKEARQDIRDFRTFTSQLNTKVKQSFTQNFKQKDAVRTAFSGLNKIQKDLAAGKKVNSIDFNTAARGLAKAFNSGAMTDQDVADFKNLTGIENITVDSINRWITGNVNPKAVEALIGIAERTGKILDDRAAIIAEGFQPQFEQQQFPGREQEIREKSGIDAFLDRTIPLQGEGEFVAEKRNRRFTRAEVTKLVNGLDKFPEKVRGPLLKQVADEFGMPVEELLKKIGR